jgi:hypothetical protein
MKILRGTIFGGIAYFLIGWLVYGILLMDYYTANTNQCLNRPEGDMVWWAMIASSLLVALLLTLILYWSKTAKATDGLFKGAVFGVIFAATLGTSYWSMTTMYSSFLPIIADIAAAGFVYGIVGLIIVLTWGRNN